MDVSLWKAILECLVNEKNLIALKSLCNDFKEY